MKTGSPSSHFSQSLTSYPDPFSGPYNFSFFWPCQGSSYSFFYLYSVCLIFSKNIYCGYSTNTFTFISLFPSNDSSSPPPKPASFPRQQLNFLIPPRAFNTAVSNHSYHTVYNTAALISHSKIAVFYNFFHTTSPPPHPLPRNKFYNNIFKPHNDLQSLISFVLTPILTL